MWQFIILGYVPGTTIQINFYTVSMVLLGAVTLLLFKSLIKEHFRFVNSKTKPELEELTN